MDTMRSHAFALFLLIAFAGVLPAQLTITTTSVPGATFGLGYSAQMQATGGVGALFWSVECDNCGAQAGRAAPTARLASASNPSFTPLRGLDLPPGLSINQSSGVISGVPTVIGQYPFTVDVSDNGDHFTSKRFSLTVSACLPTLTPATLPQGDLNVRYPPVPFQAHGCSGTFTYVIDMDPFNPQPAPPGLDLTNGSFGGTPGKVGTYTFSVTADGPNQSTVTNDYSVIINALPTVTTPSPLPSGPLGALYSQQIAATGGLPPYVFSMNNNPPALTISRSGLLSGTPTQGGAFSFNISVTDSLGGQTVAPFQVSFVSGTPQIQVSPLSLTFSADAGGNPPPTQALAIVASSGSTPPVSFHVVVDAGQDGTSAPSWITVNPASANAPAGIVVHVDQGNLGAGAYPARIRVLDSNGLPTDVSVTLNVNATAPAQLSVSPTMLRFEARSTTPGILVENLLIANTGSGALSFNATTAKGSSWISAITPNSGQASPNSPASLKIQVNTAGVAIGSYNDSIHIATPSGNADIPISLFISAGGPVLAVTPSGFFFHARQNAGSSANDTVEILNLGDPTSTVHWTASLVTGSDWLNLGATSGTATPTIPGVLSMALVQNASQLPLGPHYALLKVVDTNSLNSPQYMTAVLNIDPDTVSPSPNPTPGGLFFTTSAGGPAPVAQAVVVNTSSATPIGFQAATTTTDAGGSWLHVTPTSGTATGQSPGNLSVTVDPTGLPAGIYTGNVNVSIAQSLQSVNITFVVQPTGSSSSISGLKPQVSCAASKLAITENGLVNNFAVPAGWPATLIVQLNNDCGALVNNGSVSASFSNGDSPLSLVGDALGNYSASWQPGSINSQMVVTLNASAGSLQPAIAKLYGGVAQNQTPPPSLAPGGTLNNLNPVVGGALSPGIIAQVFGTGLSATTGSTGTLPLPKNFNNTFAQIGAFQAPLYFLSSGQLNIQIPAELATTQQVALVLSVNNALTVPITLDLVPTAPGVLSLLDGPTPPSVQNGAHMIAQHLDGTLVTSSKPGKVGEFLVMYLVGLGATNPAVPSGQPAPSDPNGLAQVTHQPTVTVDSLQSTVFFAGLTPGFVGLYQIDFQVPTGVHTGEVEVDVVQNTISANPTKLSVSE
jgi:uncharacterized protein (TIGR03437 family)